MASSIRGSGTVLADLADVFAMDVMKTIAVQLDEAAEAGKGPSEALADVFTLIEFRGVIAGAFLSGALAIAVGVQLTEEELRSDDAQQMIRWVAHALPSSRWQ